MGPALVPLREDLREDPLHRAALRRGHVGRPELAIYHRLLRTAARLHCCAADRRVVAIQNEPARESQELVYERIALPRGKAWQGKYQ